MSRVSDEAMEEMRVKLSGLGIIRPSNKNVMKAVKKAMRTPQIEEYQKGSDPRVDEALRLINDEGMDPALAAFTAWSGDGAQMLPAPTETFDVDAVTQPVNTETQPSTTGDQDDQEEGPAEE